MIAQTTIEQVKAAPIQEVIENIASVKFAKSKCACPIHEEKTASLSIKHNFFKCFGCGAAGDAISFAMQYLKCDYPSAIEAIARALGIAVEYEQSKDFDNTNEDWKAKKAIQLALGAAAAEYSQSMPDAALKYLQGRGIEQKAIEAFAIGYADKVHNLKGYTHETLIHAGLIRIDDKGNPMPFFYSRLMFPFFDFWGNIVAFTGRDLSQNPKIKYMNSPASAWDKSGALYGIYQSKSAIKATMCAYIVEGQFDVIAMWQRGCEAVGLSSGTLTAAQIDLLKNAGAKVVTIVPDNDKAGLAGLQKNALQFIEAGLICKVLFVPEGAKDAAEYLQSASAEAFQEWKASELDFIEWKAAQAAGIAENGGAFEQAAQVEEIAGLIESIASKPLREAYFDKCKKVFKALRTYKLQKRIEDVNLPEAAQPISGGEKSQHGAEYIEFSFFQKGNTLWTFEKKNEVLIANFIIEPLYFIENEAGSQYVCRFTNANGIVKTRTMAASDLTTKNAFTNFAAQLGNFIFVGNETHLGHIKMKVLEGVPCASIPKYLGWHSQFKKWVWANAIYCPTAKKTYTPDKWGIIKTPIPIKTEEQLNRIPGESQLIVSGRPLTISTIEDWKASNAKWPDLLEAGKIEYNKYFFLPSANQIGDAEESNIKKFKLVEQTSKMSFSQWANLIAQCYAESQNYIPMLGWFVGALFRDIIHKEYAWYPILNMFGAPEKGKSTAARSLARMFGEMEKDGINIESGSSETGLLRFIATFQNSVIWVNEYKNSISPKKIGVLKSIADGGGKLVGMHTAGTETKSHSAKSAAILSGQDMPTIDPALKSRCVTLEFAGTAFNYEAYKALTDWEKKLEGGEIINYLMKYRKVFETEFKANEIACQKELLEAAQEAGIKPSERLLLNQVLICTPLRIIMQDSREIMPFFWHEVIARAVESFKMEVAIANTSNDIEQFFNVLASCVGKTVEEGLHYQIIKKGGQTLLYLRLQQVAGFYREAASRQGVNPLDLSTLKAYSMKHASFIEYKPKNVKFDRLPTQTSAYIFDYDKLRAQGVELWTANDLDNQVNF